MKDYLLRASVASTDSLVMRRMVKWELVGGTFPANLRIQGDVGNHWN